MCSNPSALASATSARASYVCCISMSMASQSHAQLDVSQCLHSSLCLRGISMPPQHARIVPHALGTYTLTSCISVCIYCMPSCETAACPAWCTVWHLCGRSGRSHLPHTTKLLLLTPAACLCPGAAAMPEPGEPLRDQAPEGPH